MIIKKLKKWYKQNHIKVGVHSATLGDHLWLTPLFKNGRKGTIFIHKNGKQYAHLFNGYNVKIKITNKPQHTINYHQETHIAQQILDHFEINDVSCIPKIIISEKEKEWAHKFLKPYKNPVAVINGNSGIVDPNNHRAHLVCPPFNNIQELIDANSQYTFLQFVLSKALFSKDGNNIPLLKNVVPIYNLPIRKLAACYYVIGKYLGGGYGRLPFDVISGGKSLSFCTPSLPII